MSAPITPASAEVRRILTELNRYPAARGPALALIAEWRVLALLVAASAATRESSEIAVEEEKQSLVGRLRGLLRHTVAKGGAR